MPITREGGDHLAGRQVVVEIGADRRHDVRVRGLAEPQVLALARQQQRDGREHHADTD
jgi:hypothetical protein